MVAQTSMEAAEVLRRLWTWDIFQNHSQQDFLPDWMCGGGWGVQGERRESRDDAKVFGLSSWKFSWSPLRGLLTSFNCPLGPVAKVQTETEGRGSAFLLALGLRGWAAHTAYSITHYLLALLAFVISSLSPVWRDYKCDGFTQDTGGPIISVKPASLLGQASLPSTILATPPTASNIEAARFPAFQEVRVLPE